MTSTPALAAYATGMSRTNIEQALRSIGKDPAALAPHDLTMLEDFHTLGRLATAELAQLVAVSRNDCVLDAGSGIGGTARFLASQYDCTVTGVDLTAEYCETAEWLDASVGLADRITITQGNVTDLPFPDGTFDVVFSQHVQMNVADKGKLYSEAYRVLAPGGRLAMWDITGTADRLTYPVPWAHTAAENKLVTMEHLRRAVEAAGFRVQEWNDLTSPTSEMMRDVLAQPPSPLGLHVFVPDFSLKISHLMRGIDEGWLQVLRAVAVRAA
jgi:ubiquinone/menaquinone biosynthesis C-methylase UbiE